LLVPSDLLLLLNIIDISTDAMEEGKNVCHKNYCSPLKRIWESIASVNLLLITLIP
jgi:hypothetical protein